MTTRLCARRRGEMSPRCTEGDSLAPRRSAAADHKMDAEWARVRPWDFTQKSQEKEKKIHKK